MNECTFELIMRYKIARVEKLSIFYIPCLVALITDT